MGRRVTGLRDHDAHLAAAELDQTADRKHADRLHELLDQRLIKRCARPFAQVHQRILRRGRLGIGARCDQGSVTVCDRGHAAIEADCIGHQSARVAAAVEPLMVLGDAQLNAVWKCFAGTDDLQSQAHMFLHLLELLGGEHAGLFEQGTRHPDLADISQHADQSEFGQMSPGQPKVPAQHSQIQRHLHPVVVRIEVGIAQPPDPDQRIRVVDDAVDQCIGSGCDFAQIDAHMGANACQQTCQRRFGKLEGPACAGQFGGECPGIPVDACLKIDRQQAAARMRCGARICMTAAHEAQRAGHPVGDATQHAACGHGRRGLASKLPKALPGCCADANVGPSRIATPGCGGRDSSLGCGLRKGARRFRA